MTINSEARHNLLCLRANLYPGRGLIVGCNDSGTHIVQAAWTMGRSGGSRNRVYVMTGEHGLVKTDYADPAKPAGDPTLTIYNAMREARRCYFISNGSQTDGFIDSIHHGPGSFYSDLLKLTYEPGESTTPRISACTHVRDGVHQWTNIGLTRKSDWDAEPNLIYTRYPTFAPGIGMCIHTYKKNGNPLPSFDRSPYPVVLEGATGVAIRDILWAYLNPENRVSLVVKMIEIQTGKSELIDPINKYQLAAA